VTSAPNHALLDLLRSRRSPKLTALRAPAPSAEELSTLLTIASRVPDHGKLTPWRFIVIEGDRRHDLGKVIGEAFDARNPAADALAKAEARKRLAHSPLVVAVVFSPRGDPAAPARPHPKVPELEQVLSTGAACMSLVIAATAMGFGAVWLTEWYAADASVLAELGVAPPERLAGFVHIGTVNETREDRARPALSTIVTRY
jgi:nitroreductase